MSTLAEDVNLRRRQLDENPLAREGVDSLARVGAG